MTDKIAILYTKCDTRHCQTLSSITFRNQLIYIQEPTRILVLYTRLSREQHAFDDKPIMMTLF